LCGYHHSSETKQKISAANIGKKRTEETKKLISSNRNYLKGVSNPLYGRKQSVELLAKLSTLRTGSNNYQWGKKKKGSSSEFFGVHYSQYDKRWVCRITINKKLIHIGKYKDEEIAAKAYNDYVLKNMLKNPLNILDLRYTA
jgi:hypothetical protein